MSTEAMMDMLRAESISKGKQCDWTVALNPMAMFGGSLG